MSLAPLVADGKVLVGTSGGELGIRGHVSAFDAETGKELWKTYMVPAPGEPGSETWPKGEQWKTGGGSVWVTANYDPATNLSYWGTGNGGPWMGDRRPGDNLYIASTVAIDVATGRSTGTCSTTRTNRGTGTRCRRQSSIDYQRGGRTIKGLVNVGAQRHPVFPRAHGRPDQVRRGKAIRAAQRLSRVGSENRPPGRRPGEEPGHRQDGRLLPVVVGRKKLAACRVQSEDAAALHSRERESVLDDDRARSRIHKGTQLYRSHDDPLCVSRGEAHRRSAGVERRHRQARLDAHVRASRRTGVRS